MYSFHAYSQLTFEKCQFHCSHCIIPCNLYGFFNRCWIRAPKSFFFCFSYAQCFANLLTNTIDTCTIAHHFIVEKLNLFEQMLFDITINLLLVLLLLCFCIQLHVFPKLITLDKWHRFYVWLTKRSFCWDTRNWLHLRHFVNKLCLGCNYIWWWYN